MTLITRLVDRSACVYIGDILLLHDEDPGHPINIPTGKDINSLLLPAAPLRRIVGTAQKINILDDRLIVAWAGSKEQAQGLCTGLLSAFREGLSIEELGSFVRREHFSYRNNVSLLGTAIRVHDDAESIDVANFSYRSERVGVPHFEAHVAGTGSRDFVHLLSQIPDNLRNGDECNQGQRLLDVATSLAGQLAGLDIANGYGLLRGWGGGFEAAFLSARLRFEKVGDVLHVPWEVLPSENESYVLSMVPRIVKYRYVGDTLIVSVLDLQNPTGQADLAVHVVPPLLEGCGPVVEISDAADFSHTRLQCHIRLPDSRFLQLTKVDPVGLNGIGVIMDDKSVKIRVDDQLFELIGSKCAGVLGKKVLY